MGALKRSHSRRERRLRPLLNTCSTRKSSALQLRKAAAIFTRRSDWSGVARRGRWLAERRAIQRPVVVSVCGSTQGCSGRCWQIVWTRLSSPLRQINPGLPTTKGQSVYYYKQTSFFSHLARQRGSLVADDIWPISHRFTSALGEIYQIPRGNLLDSGRRKRENAARLPHQEAQQEGASPRDASVYPGLRRREWDKRGRQDPDPGRREGNGGIPDHDSPWRRCSW